MDGTKKRRKGIKKDRKEGRHEEGRKESGINKDWFMGGRGKKEGRKKDERNKERNE